MPDPAPPAADSATAVARRGLGQLVAGAILMLIGFSWLIEAAGWADVPWRGLLAGALIVVGVALMLGARSSAHGGLIALGIVLAVLLSLSSAITVLADIPLTGGIGEQRHRPVATVDDEYRWGIGSMTLDLREATTDLDGRTVEASVAIGELIVYVPDRIPVQIEAHTGIGEARVFGEASSGFDSDVTTSGAAGGLVLRLEVAIGKVEVRR
ncbi:MAG: cell wall-active antibiotics response protein [Acidimicrobiia bacterium]|nr:cell wall-active antibiotics response protein [Acidimicrobiia bacterium]